MVKFNELKITKDGRNLIIDVSVLDLSYYKNVYISEISIDTQDTYKDGGPSEQATKVFTTEENIKSIKLNLDEGDVLGIATDLLFIYVKTKGIPSPDTPCGMDNEYTIGVTFNTCPIYTSMFQSTKELNETCEIPVNFINVFLRYEALKMSIETGHYMKACDMFKKLFNIARVEIKRCNCYG